MIRADAQHWLRRLLDAPGPSGFEARPAAIWRAAAEEFAAVSLDVAGNSLAVVNPNGSPTIMLAGHIDEIGVIVSHVDDAGYLYIAPIGGWDPQVLVGQRIRILARDGDVHGVVGRLPFHLIRATDREKAAAIRDLWVDIGARARDDALSLVSVGDPGVIDSQSLELPNGRLASRSIDNRIGAFTVLDALRRYAMQPSTARVVGVATAQEEIAYHGGGALVSASSLHPQMAIVVDVTFATDHPNVEKKEHGEAHLDGGPALTRGSIVSPAVFQLLRSTAERESIPFTVHARGQGTGTDADAIHLASGGVATGIVEIPNRYMHSPNEMISLQDVDYAATLIAAACRQVSTATDFTAR